MSLRRPFVLLLLCVLSLAPLAANAASDVVISQVYGGGGNSGAQYKNDFIELFNRGTAPVIVTGWSVQYASAAGTTWNVTALTGTIPPGGYYLVQQAAGTGTTMAPLPAPDATGNATMSASAGKVALVASTTSLNGASCPTVVDFVGFGSTANCSEGSPTAGLGNSTAAIRKSDGCTDTDNNGADFNVAAPTPRNSASATKSCGAPVNGPPSIAAVANPIATVAQDAAPFTVTLNGTDDNSVFTWSATPTAGISSVVVSSGQGTSSATFTVTLTAGFSGTASFNASLSDGVNAAVTRAVNISVTPTVVNQPPAITPFANPVATVDQDAAPFAVSFTGSDENGIYNWSATAGTGVSSVAVASGQGTPEVTFTVTLQPGFSGTAAFTAALSDGVNPNVTSQVTVNVTPAPPTPLDHLVISQIYGGNGGFYRHDFVELFNPTTSAIDVGGWSVQYASSTGSSWQVQILGGIIQPGEYYLVRMGSNAGGADVPEANVSGTIAIGQSAGKIALVQSLEALTGTCPLGSVVDFVGYGSTNCSEGDSPVPALTAALAAAIRKGGGFADTNVNSADFTRGAPSPRRTTPIQEIGPFVASSDPRVNGQNVPRDGSLTVYFTEPVDVTGAWYSIDCADSGRHDDATVARIGAGSFVVTPNRNFDAGEQCTATIFAMAVSDSDTDDSGPYDDHLRSDYIFSFTVASGAQPPYTSDVHLMFGNPSSAAADLQQPNNYLMLKPEFALSYNRDRGTPNWVSWHLTDEWVGTLSRVDTFRPDPAVPAEWYRVLHTDYAGSGFDRGHMVPNADRDHQDSVPINQATFLMTNMLPQAPDNNQGPWAAMENYLRDLLYELGPDGRWLRDAQGNPVPSNTEVYIVAGGAGDGGTGSEGAAATIANGKVAVPAFTWKAALVMPRASGNDAARVTAATRTIAVIMPNVQGIRNVDWDGDATKPGYLTTIDAIEQLTGYDLFANVPDAIEKAIEAGTNGLNPPAVEVTAPASGVEGSAVAATVFVSDNASGSSTTTWTVALNGSTFSSGTGTSVTFTPVDDGAYVITATVTAADGATASSTATVPVSNAAPVITSSSATSTPIALGGAATASVSYSDAGTDDTHTAVFTWSDGSSSTATCETGSCTASHTYAATGVYPTSVVVTDDDGGIVSSTIGNVVVYDTNGGSITGGGFITTAAGKATFNLNARYLKGSSKPTGSTRLELASATLASTSHDWLVINGTTARYQGSGTIDGAGDYGFLVVATDGGAADTIQFRVWEKATGATIFDSGPASVSGSINLHK